MCAILFSRDYRDVLSPPHSNKPIFPIFVVVGMMFEQIHFSHYTRRPWSPSLPGFGSIKGEENPYNKVGM